MIKSSLIAGTLLAFAATACGPQSQNLSGEVQPITHQGSFTDAARLSLNAPYVLTVSGVEMKIYPPAAGLKPQQALRLAIYLHGDTARDYTDEYYRSLKDETTRKGMLFVAALAPNKNSWWHQDSFADNFAHALNAILGRYNVARDKILYAGVSGGSTFMTMQFLPKYGNTYPGTLAAMCGGAPPRPFQYNVTPTIAGKIDLFFTYGSQDFLANPKGSYGAVIPGSIQAYRAKGFPVYTKVIPAAEHCKFNTNGEILAIWNQTLRR